MYHLLLVALLWGGGVEDPSVVPIEASAQPQEGIYAMLRRHQLPTTGDMVNRFVALNTHRLGSKQHLRRGQVYRLPIMRYAYNGRSIRSTMGMNDYARAVRIKAYNEEIQRAQLKPRLYTEDGELWVPFHEMEAEQDAYALPSSEASLPVQVASMSTPAEPALGAGHYPILGPQHARVPYESNALAGCVYYLVSGHGGPDPGAQGRYGNHILHEDEYAYDVTLRLARALLTHRAKVYVIVRDDEGIQDVEILRSDRDEYYYGGEPIPRNHKARLERRAEVVNDLYEMNRATARQQRVVMVHVDANPGRTAIQKDVYFFYNESSHQGRRLSGILQETFRDKYGQHQPHRGYSGPRVPRDLYMLRETKPVAVLVELGNISHTLDRQRLVKVQNRQALANWLAEGLMREAGVN